MLDITPGSTVSDYARGAIYHIDLAQTDVYAGLPSPPPGETGPLHDADFHLAWGRDDLTRTAELYARTPNPDMSLVARLNTGAGAAQQALATLGPSWNLPPGIEDARQAAYQVLRNIGSYPLPD